MELFRDFSFEAAHRLPSMPPEHKCARLHGHSYRVRIHITGERNPDTGMVLDFAEVKSTVAPLLNKHLDHRYLNDVDGLDNPTAENVAVWIWARLEPELPLLTAVEVQETCTCGVVYRGPGRECVSTMDKSTSGTASAE